MHPTGKQKPVWTLKEAVNKITSAWKTFKSLSFNLYYTTAGQNPGESSLVIYPFLISKIINAIERKSTTRIPYFTNSDKNPLFFDQQDPFEWECLFIVNNLPDLIDKEAAKPSQIVTEWTFATCRIPYMKLSLQVMRWKNNSCYN